MIGMTRDVTSALLAALGEPEAPAELGVQALRSVTVNGVELSANRREGCYHVRASVPSTAGRIIGEGRHAHLDAAAHGALAALSCVMSASGMRTHAVSRLLDETARAVTQRLMR